MYLTRGGNLVHGGYLVQDGYPEQDGYLASCARCGHLRACEGRTIKDALQIYIARQYIGPYYKKGYLL